MCLEIVVQNQNDQFIYKAVNKDRGGNVPFNTLTRDRHSVSHTPGCDVLSDPKALCTSVFK